jgi:hypothetical protein
MFTGNRPPVCGFDSIPLPLAKEEAANFDASVRYLVQAVDDGNSYPIQ